MCGVHAHTPLLMRVEKHTETEQRYLSERCRFDVEHFVEQSDMTYADRIVKAWHRADAQQERRSTSSRAHEAFVCGSASTIP